MIEYIVHRINRSVQLKNISSEFGIELDLRDKGERLILNHDPFEDGEDLDEYLKFYKHGTMILNIKSERIEWRILEEIKESGKVEKYFFLDSTYPMIHSLVKMGERNIAVRYSEFEPIENALALAGDVKWVWVDCFTHLPLNDDTYKQFRDANFKICVVSPELQNHSINRIEEFAKILGSLPVDAICTKHPNIWKQAFKI